MNNEYGELVSVCAAVVRIYMEDDICDKGVLYVLLVSVEVEKIVVLSPYIYYYASSSRNKISCRIIEESGHESIPTYTCNFYS